MKLQASADGGGKLARNQPRVHAQPGRPLRPCRQPQSMPPGSRAAQKPHSKSSVVAAAAATRGQGAFATSHDNHASELSPEAAKEGMYWLAAWVSSQYMGMGKSAEDAMPELRRRGVVCSSAHNGQVLFKVPDQEAALDGPQVIKLLRLKARPGVKLADPAPPAGLAPSKPAPMEPPSTSPSRDESPRSTSPSREYQVGRLPDSPDSLAMRWLAEWIATRYTGFGKKAEDVLPELRRRGVVYSSIKDGRVMFRVPGVVSRVEASQIIYMLRLQPRPGVRPEEPEPPQSLMSMLAGSRMEDASPMRQATPSGSRSSSPNRYSSPSRTRASTTLSPEAAALGMRWLAIYVSSQYSGMGRSAEDALPELKAQGVVCTSVRDGRPMFVVPSHEGEVDAQDVVKLLRLEVRPGVRPRAPTPPPALASARSAPAGVPAEKPAQALPQATVEDGFKWLASWVATNYMGMGKTVADALPELRRRGILCSSVKGNTTPMFRMPGQTAEIDGAQVIKSLRLQARPGVDSSKPSPPRGLVLGTSGAPPKAPAAKPPPPSASTTAAKPSPSASAATKPSPSASAAVATAAASAAARRASLASSKAPSTSKAPSAASSAIKAEPKAAPKAEPKTEPKAEPNPPPEKPPPPFDPDNNIILFLGQLLLPAAVTLVAAAAIGGGSILWEKLSASGIIPLQDELVKQKVTQSGSFKVGGAAPSVTVKPREPVSAPAVEPLPPPPPPPPPPPKIGVQNQGGAVSPLDAQREQELRVVQEQEQRRVQQEERERQQRFREEQEQERVAKEQEARAQQLKEQQEAKEQQAREQQLREGRARQEREQKEREQKEKEQKEKERKEQEQREKEQKEMEQKEQEQREKEQKEKEQKEREQREREQREREQKEQEQKEKQLEKEQKAREQREKEQREKEQKEREMQEQEQRQKEQREKEQKEREEKERMQREKEQREREKREKEQKEREQKAREQREREQKEREQKEEEQREREQQEQEQKEREALEKQQKERAQKEREEREKRQRELEQREREDLEKQQRERAQQEREQREKEQREREQKERLQLMKEQEQEGLKKEMEQKEQEQKEQEQRVQEQQAQEQKAQEAAVAPPVQAQGLQPRSRPSGVQPLPGALQQGGVQPQPKGGVLPKLYGPYIDPNKPRGVQPLPPQDQREGVQPAPEGPFEPPNQPRGLLPETEESQPPKIDGPQRIGGGISGALSSTSGTGPQAQAKQVEEGFGDSEEDLAKDLSTLATPGSKGILQQGGGQIEGYEACIYRSIGC